MLDNVSRIICQQLQLSYPVYHLDSRSFKRCLTSLATGGRFINEDEGLVKVNALHNISFQLQEGDRLGLIGHNGAGKSTLLRVLAGVYEPDAGFVQVKGKISSLLNISVGMQPTLTGYENIYVRWLFLGLSKYQIEGITEDIAAFTELGKYLSMPVKTYSSGMMIRLAFGLSTAVTPDILLIDEVIGAGDSNFMQKAKQRLDRIIKQSKILALASHSNETIKQFCNKAIWLENGSIKMSGEVKEVINAYEKKCQLINSTPELVC